MSNRDRLEEAGIIEKGKTLSREQDSAIESLSEEEVDHLISVNDKLYEAKAFSSEDPILEMPGINPPTTMEE